MIQKELFMKVISDETVEKLRKAECPEDVIQDFIKSGNGEGAELFLLLKEREKGPFLTLDEAARELGISKE